MQIHHRQVDVVEQLGVVLDRVARGEEHNDLLLAVFLQEGEKEEEAIGRLAHDEALLERRHRRGGGALLRGHVDRLVLYGEARKVGHILRLCGREEGGLPIGGGEQLDDRAHVLFEPNLQDAIGLVDGEHLEVGKDETPGGGEMVEQPTRRADQVAHALCQLVRLGASVGTADDKAERLPVRGAQFREHTKDLERELTRRRDGNRAGAVARRPLCTR
mmetsp:Transcript_4279/g.9394  ORF Transcript_4279/g.9394 Transcript_4279/m.9394 type:complete len:217 (-) Transcript_4279:608-1258(-)